MNTVTDIVPAATFELPLETTGVPVAPPLLVNPSPLPATLIDRLKDAAPWVAPYVFSTDKLFLTYIHVAGRKVYAGQGQAVVEFDLGDADVHPFVISPREIRPLAAFREPPTSLNTEGGLLFGWGDERRLFLRHNRSAPAVEKFAAFIMARNDLEPITDEWRAQIDGRFSSYKVDKNSSVGDLLHITDGRIEGGIDGTKIVLNTDTHCDGKALIERKLFLSAIKIADRIRFAEVEGFQRLFFEGPNVRGTISTRKQPSRPTWKKS